MKKLLSFFFATVITLSGCTTSTNSIQKVPVTLDNTVPSITVKPIENLSEDFILGCDVSSLIALENSGVIFYNNKKTKITWKKS